MSAHAIFLWEHAKVTPRAKVKGAFAAVRQLKKRDARQRLEAMASVNGSGHKSFSYPKKKASPNRGGRHADDR